MQAYVAVERMFQQFVLVRVVLAHGKEGKLGEVCLLCCGRGTVLLSKYQSLNFASLLNDVPLPKYEL